MDVDDPCGRDQRALRPHAILSCSKDQASCDADDATSPPSTEKRRREAATKGDVLRSREVATAVAMLVGAAWLQFAGPWLFDGLSAALRAGLSWDRHAVEQYDPAGAMLAAVWAVTPPLLSLALAVMLSVSATQLAHGDGRWVGASALPKASRLDPLAGFKRMFGAQGWIEVGKTPTVRICSRPLLSSATPCWSQ